MSTAIGVDGAPGGWVAGSWAKDGQLVLVFHDSFQSVLSTASPSDAIVVDMPIGLPTNGDRPVDAEVKARLGQRRATFFPTPLRSVLDFDEWADANEHSKAVSGKGLSKQSWNLTPKIAEIDSLWSPELATRLREGHPETSFAEMSGAALSTKKATVDGRLERVSLLSNAISSEVASLIDAFPKKWSIDAVDALALCWTARRLLLGQAITLGGDLDEHGRPMALTI